MAERLHVELVVSFTPTGMAARTGEVWTASTDSATERVAVRLLRSLCNQPLSPDVLPDVPPCPKLG